MAAAISFFPASPLLAASKRTQLPAVTSGIAAFDQRGGIPRAALTDLAGAPSSGRASVLLSLFRHVAARGECSVLLDAQDSFDPRSAAEAGVDLSRLLWVRCRDVEQTLKAGDLLVHAGGFTLVVLDLSGIEEHLTRRIPAAVWFRLRRGAEQSGCALVVSGQHRLAGSCAQLQMTVRQASIASSRQRLTGLSAQLECHKGRPGFQAALRIAR